MRKLVGVTAVAVLLVALAAGAAYAVDGAYVQCTGVPCFASGDSDLVFERRGNGLTDDIRMKGGDDLVRANTYGNDTDTISGGTGFDKIYVNDGDVRDSVSSGTSRGGSWCIVDARIEASQGCTRVSVAPPR